MRVHPNDIPLYHLPKFTRMGGSSFQIGHLNPAEFGDGSSIPDRHSFYTIFWFTSGSGTHFIDFIPYEIKPNSIFMFRPGQTHYFEVNQAPEGYRVFMEQDLNHSKFDLKIYDFFQLTHRSPVIYIDDAEGSDLQILFNLLLAEFGRMSDPANEAMAHLLKLVLLKLEGFYDTRFLDQGEGEADQLIDQFQQLVEDQYFEQHRIKHYASQLGITADYLSERVKMVLGVPPSKLIHHRLMVEAKRLLAYTDLTSAEISHTLGFNDSAYFSRFFKRETSQTPLKFRGQIREKYNHHPE